MRALVALALAVFCLGCGAGRADSCGQTDDGRAGLCGTVLRDCGGHAAIRVTCAGSDGAAELCQCQVDRQAPRSFVTSGFCAGTGAHRRDVARRACGVAFQP